MSFKRTQNMACNLGSSLITCSPCLHAQSQYCAFKPEWTRDELIWFKGSLLMSSSSHMHYLLYSMSKFGSKRLLSALSICAIVKVGLSAGFSTAKMLNNNRTISIIASSMSNEGFSRYHFFHSRSTPRDPSLLTARLFAKILSCDWPSGALIAVERPAKNRARRKGRQKAKNQRKQRNARRKRDQRRLLGFWPSFSLSWTKRAGKGLFKAS